MLNPDNYTLPAQPDLPASQDYAALRAQGIAHIQRLSGQLWTDYNVHDPGVTILELLCYALTDLGYRTNFDIRDLLTKPQSFTPNLGESVFTAREILTFHPVTLNDYRKLLLDHFLSLRNVWLKPIQSHFTPHIFVAKNHAELTYEDTGTNPALTVGGFYTVQLELQDSDSFDFRVTTAAEADDIKSAVHRFLLNHRNLCEDFVGVDLVQYEYVGVCADFELDQQADPVAIKKQIYQLIYAYITPSLHFYTIAELLAKGRSIEEIFQGSVAENGFIDYAELEAFESRKVLYTSDLIHLLISSIKGIRSIRKIHLSSYQLDATGQRIDLKNPLKTGEKYCLHLTDPNRVFRLRLDLLDDPTDKNRINKFSFFFNELQVPIRIKPGEVTLDEIVPKRRGITDLANDLPALRGKNRDLEHYYSIQNEFPKVYLLGQESISEQFPDARKAQRLQLKGYLLFFEQLLADYLSQLNNASELLSWSDKPDDRSYFYQALSGEEIVDLNELKLPDYDDLFDHNTYSETVLGQTPIENFNRRNRFLNHLISRFNDSFVEFSIAQFIRYSSAHRYTPAAIVADKKSFLRSYPKLSGERSHAFNYEHPVWNTPNLSGFELRIAKKLGLSNTLTADSDALLQHSLIHPFFQIDDTGALVWPEPRKYRDNRDLSFDEIFGLHIIEHQLLVPRWGVEKLLDICEEPDNFGRDCFCRDPYSFRVTAVLPGWLPISMDMSFRKYVENLIREELPAHLSLKICWIGPDEMFEFEQNYFAFANCLSGFAANHTCYQVKEEAPNPDYVDSLNRFITTINGLNNMYPPSYLVDCDDIELDENNTIKKHPVILNRTALREYEPRNIWQKPEPDPLNPARSQTARKIVWKNADEKRPIPLDLGQDSTAKLHLTIDRETYTVFVFPDRDENRRITGGRWVLNDEVSYPLNVQLPGADGSRPAFYVEIDNTVLVIDFANAQPLFSQSKAEQQYFESRSTCPPTQQPERSAQQRFEAIFTR
ncbi:hypothetical protein [Larkinella rosea]|uniref:Uncharacterized protein n=1 Tax=Larkinella rosea TaxID=2025312 RepID=A0A3P1C3T1_9BACT|nr:hypothetical protein [Larkinella rosea]RRB07763.1 hypothetical protein EHT25_08310 [Larkinella rosea]